MSETSAHVFITTDGDARCLNCDCRPYGIHASHGCTYSEDCSSLH